MEVVDDVWLDVVGGRTEVEADSFAFAFRSGRLGKTVLRRGAGLDEMDDCLGLMPRYFFIIGDKGSVKLWTLRGNRHGDGL